MALCSEDTNILARDLNFSVSSPGKSSSDSEFVFAQGERRRQIGQAVAVDAAADRQQAGRQCVQVHAISV